MALSAAKTFIAAEVLYAADLNTLNTNILNNALALISPLTASLDAGNFDITALDELGFTDAAANPSASGRLRRNGSALMWAVEDARTNTTTRVLTAQATTTGTPAASIGVGMLFNAESGDENPANFGALDFIATDITAGTEDTVLGILLRIAGAALTEVYRLQATGAFLLTVTHALTAARTLTIPDATTTLVGTDTTQTLTNKTLTSPVIATIVNTGTLTLPTTTDTMVARATTDTLTNKTLTAPVIGAASGTPAQNAAYADSLVKGWVKADSTGTIRDSFNVTSIADTATGRVTITWDRDFANASYVVVATTQILNTEDRLAAISNTNVPAAGTTEVISTAGGTLTDPTEYHVLAVGDAAA